MPERFEIDWGVGEALRDFQSLRMGLGSSGETAGAAAMFGAGAGISDIRGAAEALHRASLSGMGQITAAKYGIPFRPFEIGEATDRGAMIIQAIEGLRETARTQGRGFAIAEARNLSIEELLPVLDLTAQQIEKIKQDSLVMKEIYTPQRAAAAFMLNHELSRMDLAFNQLTVTIGSLFIPMVTSWLEGVNARIDRLRNVPNLSWSDLGKPPAEGLKTSMDGLKTSVDKNTLQLRNMQGFFGGGREARSAIPGAFALGVGMGQFISDNLRTLNKSIGSSSLNA